MNKQNLTSLITRLEEEYGKAGVRDWGRVGVEMSLNIDDNKDAIATFIADAHNSMPTLLSALRHFMTVAEAGETAVRRLRDYTEWLHSVKDANTVIEGIVTAYRQALDTP